MNTEKILELTLKDLKPPASKKTSNTASICSSDLNFNYMVMYLATETKKNVQGSKVSDEI